MEIKRELNYNMKKKGCWYPYIILGLCSSVWTLIFVDRTILPAVLPLVETELQLTHAQAGSLIGAVLASFSIVVLPASFLSEKIGAKQSILLSILWFSSTALCITLVNSYLELLLAMLIFGLGLGMYFPSGISLISELFPSESRGKVLGIHEAAPPVGMIISFFVASLFAGMSLWKPLFMFCALPGFLLAFMFWRYVKEERGKTSFRTYTAFRVVLKDHGLLLLLVPFTLNVICVQGILGMFPLYLVNECSVDASTAAIIMGIARIGGILGSFIAGLISDKFGRTPTLFILLATTAAFTLSFALFPFSSFTILALFFSIFSTDGYYPVNFALISDIMSPTTRASGAALHMTVALIIGGGMAPVIAGWIADVWGFYFVFLFLASSAALGTLLLWALRKQPQLTMKKFL